jgi:hypothetical protein
MTDFIPDAHTLLMVVQIVDCGRPAPRTNKFLENLRKEKRGGIRKDFYDSTIQIKNKSKRNKKKYANFREVNKQPSMLISILVSMKEIILLKRKKTYQLVDKELVLYQLKQHSPSTPLLYVNCSFHPCPYRFQHATMPL